MFCQVNVFDLNGEEKRRKFSLHQTVENKIIHWKSSGHRLAITDLCIEENVKGVAIGTIFKEITHQFSLYPSLVSTILIKENGVAMSYLK